MDRDKFTETMIALMNQRPFRPFSVVTVSGGRYEVDYPNALSVREGPAIVAGPGRVPAIFDHEGVSEVIGDLSGRGVEVSQNRFQNFERQMRASPK